MIVKKTKKIDKPSKKRKKMKKEKEKTMHVHLELPEKTRKTIEKLPRKITHAEVYCAGLKYLNERKTGKMHSEIIAELFHSR